MATPPFPQSFSTAGGGQIISLPLEAFPGFVAYAYLALADGMCVLVDSGFGSELSNQNLEKSFDQVSQLSGRLIRLEDLTHVLVTHGHIDHFGGLPFLRARTQAQIGVHELDLQTVARHEERLSVMTRRLEVYLVEAGTPPDQRQAMLETYRFTKSFYRSVAVDFTYQAAGMQLGPFEMLHVPGHCPGHVAIRLHDFIFAGDHILPETSTHQSPEQLTPFTGLGHYLESMKRFVAWAQGARLVLVGHQSPIRGLAARAEEVHQRIVERLQKTLTFLAEAHTISEVAYHLYGETQGYNALLVLEKAGAHIEYLHQRGLLQIVNVDELDTNGQPVAIRFRQLEEEIPPSLVF